MYEDLPGLYFFLTAIALAPAILLWRRGRGLASALDDPALPERLEASRRRSGSVIAIVFGILAVMSPGSMIWTIPLLIAGHIVSSYPLRKKLYAETWTFRGYLAFVGRSGFSIWGFWIALALLPVLAPKAGRYDWIVALVAATVLLVWNARSDTVLRRVIGSRPITDPALLERFTAIARRSSVATPRFEWIPLHGGAISNALALPALPQSSVLFTDTLLAQMDLDEVAAICAHEIAHLEHHTPRFVRRLNVVNIATIAIGALLGVLPRLAGLESTMLPLMLWVVVLFGGIAWRARDRQKSETASDIRAVALTGDGEALVRGLTKLYTFARMPRRLDADVERRATHPSLARRIRDIRAAAGAAPAALGETSVFVATDGRATVTFDNDRLHWAEGDVATHSLSYSQFSELRLHVDTGKGTSFLAIQQDGRRWQAALEADDVPRLQAVLDIVDGRLADARRPPATFGNLARLAAGFAAAFALLATQMAMLIAALIALVQPSTPMLAGAGVAALASALLTLRAFAGAAIEMRAGLSAMLALLGVGLLAAAYTRRGDRVPPRGMIGVAILAIAATFWTGLMVLNGLDPIHLHLFARSMPAGGVFLLTLGTTLVCLPARPVRYAAVPVLLAGLTALSAGSPLFLDRFGRDPFLQPAPPIVWTTLSGSLQREAHVPLYVSAVELSPAARALIVHAYDAAEQNVTVHVGRPGGPLTRVRAEHVAFMDDDRVIGVYGAPVGDLEIRETHVDAPDVVVWRREISGFLPHSLSYDAGALRWTVRGFAEGGALVQVHGDVESGRTRETRWPPLAAGTVPEHTAVTGDTALVHETEYAPSVLQRHGWWRIAMLIPGRQPQSRFSRLTPTARSDAARSRLQTECVNASRLDGALLCSAFDGTRTRFASIDPGPAQVTPLAWMPGQFRASVLSSSGWLSGWADWHPVAIRPATHEGLRFDASPGRITQLTATDRTFAVVSLSDGASTIRIYSRDEARRAAR